MKKKLLNPFKFLKVQRIFFVLLICLFIFASCNNTEKTGKKILRLASELTPTSLYAHHTSESVNFDIIGQITEGLVEYDQNKKLIPAQAEKWDVSPDGLIYTFTLRPNMKWSNGESVTAKDYVFAWQTLAGDKSADYQFMLDIIKNGPAILAGKQAPETLGVVAKDDRTLIVTLESPIAYFLDYMAFPIFFPLNEKGFKEIGANQYGTSLETIVTNGPFKLKKYAPDLEIHYEKNLEYWNAETVKLDEVHVRIVADLTSQATLFDQGELDVLKLDNDLIDLYKDASTLQPQLESRMNYLYLSGSTSMPAEELDNKDFRLALAHAFDKEAIAKNILKNGSIGADFLIPKEFANIDGQDFRTYSGKHNKPIFNITEAKAYLDKAKAALGKETFTVKIAYRDLPIEKLFMENIKSQIEKNLPGVTIELASTPNQLYFKEIMKLNTPAGFAGWSPDYFDVSTFFELFTKDSPYNYGKIDIPAYNRLIAEAKTAQYAQDIKGRANLYVQAEDILLAEGYFLPLYQRGTIFNIKSYVKNYHLGAITPTVSYKYVDIQE